MPMTKLVGIPQDLTPLFRDPAVSQEWEAKLNDHLGNAG